MRSVSPKDLKPSGRFILFYSEAGVGKTVSILKSVNYPLLYGACEPRNPLLSFEIADAVEKDSSIVIFDKWEEVMAYFANDKETERFETIFLDGINYLYNVDLSMEIEDEAFSAREVEALKAETPIIKRLVQQSKLSEEGYGALAGQMIRLLKLLGRLSQQGKTVILTTHVTEYPKWDRDLVAAPSFKGKMINLALPGFIDLIGKVKTRVDKSGNIIYPPMVEFESPDNSFVAKYNGVKPDGVTVMSGPLNVNKILEITQPKKNNK